MSAEVDAQLAHFGIKGMKWGVRKDDSGGGSKGGWTDDQKRKLKNVATVAAVGAAAVGVAYLAKHKLDAKISAEGAANVQKMMSDPNLMKYFEEGMKAQKAAMASPGASAKAAKFKDLANMYKENPQAAEWLRTSAPESFAKIMKFAG